MYAVRSMPGLQYAVLQVTQLDGALSMRHAVTDGTALSAD
jgi:hypothetical protein